MKNVGWLRKTMLIGVIQDSRKNESPSLYDANMDLPKEEKRAWRELYNNS